MNDEGSGKDTPLRVTRTTVVVVSDSFPRQHARTQRFSLGVPRSFNVAGDGTEVLFLRSSGPEDPINALWTINTLTGVERVIADPQKLVDHGKGELSAAERSRRERARESASGITTYSVNSSGSAVTFALMGEIFVADVHTGAITSVNSTGGAFDPRLSGDSEYVSFVVGDSLYIGSADGSQPARMLKEGDGKTVSWGSAEFVAAEEMRRSRGHWWDPHHHRLAVAHVDVTHVNLWHISAPDDPAKTPQSIRYPAAGTANAEVRLYVVDVHDASQVEVKWNRSTHPYLVNVTWEDAAPLTITVQSRDQRSMLVLEVEASSGSTNAVLNLEDPDWVEIVPGTPKRWNGGWLTIEEHDHTRSLLFDGTPLSAPNQWVRSLVDANESRVLYTASTDPTTVDLWSFHDNAHEPLTGGNGVVQAVGSNSVTVIEQSSMESTPQVTVITDQHEWEIDSWQTAPMVHPAVQFVQTESLGIQTAVLFPTEPSSEPLPVLMDPYGGPHAQRVLRSRHAYLVSQWFADQGFCVIIADGPGTPGRGNGWERSVRGDLARPVLEGQIEALQTVAQLYPDRVDLTRVAIRGWSFGGYLAALAVIRQPDTFHAAIAGAPVTDWKLYDTHYTERYLGHPETEPDNYRRTSLLAEAAQLQRPLMLIHGLADDNVVASHTLQLSASLLAAGRPHEVLPLSGVTHMTPQEQVAENLLLLQVDFLRRNLHSDAIDA